MGGLIGFTKLNIKIWHGGQLTIFTHSPRRWNHGSTDGFFHLLLLLLHTTNFMFLLGTKTPIFKLVWLSRQLLWLLSLLAPSLSISCSVFVWRTVHSCPENCPQTPVTPIALQYNPALGWIYNWLTNKSQPWAGYKIGSLLLFEENRQYSQYKSEFQNNIANSKIQVLTVQTYNIY